jgi:FkbM family methyltransferase
MYQIIRQTFRTPRGAHVTMFYREDTNDWNTLTSCLTEDEYGLRNLHLAGRALDIGAYIGGVTVALLADNPELQVTAVEPVPDNVALLRQNLEANELADRCTIIEGAVGDGRKVNIRYGYSGSECATHHAFIGNVSLIAEPGPDNPHTVRKMTGQKVPNLGEFEFAKIDCEGCEWDVDLSSVPRIRGEWHPVRSHIRDEFLQRLAATHEVTFSGPTEGPGGFEAVAR